jgi:hypothetical protein
MNLLAYYSCNDCCINAGLIGKPIHQKCKCSRSNCDNTLVLETTKGDFVDVLSLGEEYDTVINNLTCKSCRDKPPPLPYIRFYKGCEIKIVGEKINDYKFIISKDGRTYTSKKINFETKLAAVIKATDLINRFPDLNFIKDA